MDAWIFLLMTMVSCGALVLIVFRFLKKQSDKEVTKLRTELHKQRQEFFFTK
jgi:hypothetical protein